ncbi:MAG: hypothetical protein MR889_01465, partial [Clostridiales bacterium]|nr:hypothetical protein [Clostridiales bacterium]
AVGDKKPVIDGKIDDGEYAPISFSKDDLMYLGYDDARLAEMKDTDVKIYASYDAENVYIGVVVSTPDFVQTSVDGGNMWQNYCVQLCGATADESDSNSRSELAYSRNSETGDLLFMNWSSGYLGGYTADTTGKDFAVVTKNGVTTYEIAMPAAAFGADSLKEGGKIGLDITMVFSDDNGPAVIEWAQGCYVAKDSTVFAKVTLGEPMKAPAAASDDTSAATADTFSVCLAALAMSAAALALRKKH